MEKKNLKEIFQPALKFAGVLGTVGGFVGDVLSPLGPVLNYLLAGSRLWDIGENQSTILGSWFK